MKRWTIFLFLTAFLLLGLQSSGQTKKDTTYIAKLTSDSVVQRGDTTYLYKTNGCIKEKGIWDFKGHRWIGKYFQYYDSTCGQIYLETLYDNYGKLIWRKCYDDKGKLLGEYKPGDKSGQMISDSLWYEDGTPKKDK